MKSVLTDSGPRRVEEFCPSPGLRSGKPIGALDSESLNGAPKISTAYEQIVTAMNGARYAIFAKDGSNYGVTAIGSECFDVIDINAKTRFRVSKSDSSSNVDLHVLSTIQASNLESRIEPGQGWGMPVWVFVDREFSPADYYEKEPVYERPTLADLQREMPSVLKIVSERRKQAPEYAGLTPWQALSRPNHGNCGSACGILYPELAKRFGVNNIRLKIGDVIDSLRNPLNQGHSYFEVRLHSPDGRPTDQPLIVDFTWIQFFSTEKVPGLEHVFPDELIDKVPLPFIGSRDEMARLFRAHPSLTSQSFGRQPYGLDRCLELIYPDSCATKRSVRYPDESKPIGLRS